MAEAQAAKESVTFKLDGKDVSVPKGWTVMMAAEREGVKIPHFCWHPGLSVAGVCRFCMVKVEGRPKLEIACNLQAIDGMVVSTKTDEVKDAHKWALEFHLINHPLDCPICDQAGECGLQDYYMKVGKYPSQMHRPKVLKPKALDVGGDLVLDTERCILCSRCVRFEDEVTKSGALGIFDRGDRSIIGTYPGRKVEHNYTANLVDICPVGAFTSKDFRFKQRVWFLQDKPSTCPGCSTGCQVKVFAREDTRRYFRMKPRQSDVNGHWMCDSGRHMYEHVNKENRLLFPYADVGGGKAIKVDQDTAVSMLAARLQSVPATDIGLLVSAQYTNEEYSDLFAFFVKELGVTQVYTWREPTEKVDEFDGILLRGDRNANTAGLAKAMADAGLSARQAQGFQELAKAKASVVVALAPEIPLTFPSLKAHFASLAELPFVSLWSASHLAGTVGVKHAIPMKCFTEKVGTFTSHGGRTSKLESPFPPAVVDAMSVSELVSAVRSQMKLQAK